MRLQNSRTLTARVFTAGALAAGFLLGASPASIALAEGPNVVASIKPVHSLVSGVMGEIATPHLLVSGADSPHTFAMRPSNARALAEADVVFWIGEQIETFLQRPIANLSSNAHAVSLIDAPGMTLLHYEDNEHEEHAHDDDHEGEDEHDEAHANEAKHEAGHEHDEEHADEAKHEAGHEHDEGHEHSGIDGHIWLDPTNAKAMVQEIVKTLSQVDTANADAYRANGEALSKRLTALEADTADKLAAYRDVPYFTFHDSFRYFEARFGLDGHGAISISPERQPGVQRLQEIRDQISEFEQVCIFAEPQFPPKLVNVIVEGTTARIDTLDPLGASLDPGTELYFDLIGANGDAFSRCFQNTM